MQVSIICPEGLVFRGEADQVVLPGSEGEFAVLDRHALLLAELKMGVITLYKGKKATRKFTIGGGYADVSGTQCDILADSIENEECLSEE